MVRASALPEKFLGIALPAAPKPAEAAPAAAEGQPTPEVAPAAPEPVLTIEQRAKFARMQGDLRWLVTEGYVTEFIDGRLFAPPPMVEARKREVESEEHDPENFPEVPADSRPPMAVVAPVTESMAAPAPEAAAEPEVPALPAAEPVGAATAEPAAEVPAAPAAEPPAAAEPAATEPSTPEPAAAAPAVVVPVAEPPPAAPSDEPRTS